MSCEDDLNNFGDDVMDAVGSPVSDDFSSDWDNFVNEFDVGETGQEYLDMITGEDAREEAEAARAAGDAARATELDLLGEQLDWAKETDARDFELAKEQDERNYAFGQEQFGYAKELDARNFGAAQEQDQYRRGLVDDMMADSAVERVGVDELENRLGDASSDTTRAFLKARGITGRDMARYGISPSGSRYTKMLKDNERDLAVTDVGVRNAVRTGVRGENRMLDSEENARTSRARLAGMGLTDSSLGLTSNQLNQNMPLMNQSQLNVRPNTPGAMGNMSNYYGSEADRNFRDSDMYMNSANSSLGNLVNTGMTVWGMSGGFGGGGGVTPSPQQYWV